MSKRLLAATLYALAFLAQYQWLTVPLFGYWGFSGLANLSECLWLLPMMVAPAFFMPEAVDRPSALLAFLNYAILYVPLCAILFRSTRTLISPADLWAIWAALAASTVALFYVPRLKSLTLVRPRVNRKALLRVCWCALAAVLLAALAVNRIHLIGFKDIAATREAYSAHVRALGGGFAYADAWAGLALIPFLFAERLKAGRTAACLGLTAVCLVLFLLSGRKTDLLTPPAVLAGYLAVKRGLKPAALLSAFAVLLLLPFLFGALGLQGLRLLWINVVNFRVFAVPQVLVPQYYAYYLSHGFTHFRHVNLVNRLFYGGAPFEQPWSAIAKFYYKKSFTADAVFYATDGLAALGVIGIPCITVALVAVLWVFDSLQKRLSPLLVLPALLPFLFSLFNNSLFTTLLSGGGFLLMLLFYLLPDGA